MFGIIERTAIACRASRHDREVALRQLVPEPDPQRAGFHADPRKWASLPRQPARIGVRIGWNLSLPDFPTVLIDHADGDLFH